MNRDSGSHLLLNGAIAAGPNTRTAPAAPHGNPEPPKLEVSNQLLDSLQGARHSAEQELQNLKKSLARLQVSMLRGFYLTQMKRPTPERAETFGAILSQANALVELLATKVDRAREWSDAELATAADRLRWACDLVSRLEAK